MEKILNVSRGEFQERRKYKPETVPVFDGNSTSLVNTDLYSFKIHPDTESRLSHIADNAVQQVMLCPPGSPEGQTFRKKRRIAIVFSGGPAPGGHNVIAGLFDAAKAANPENELLGFLAGPEGILEGSFIPIEAALVDNYRNLGGFSMIRTGRTKIDTEEKTELSRKTCKALGLDALVIVGGDDSNTNAAFLAQDLFEDGIQVIGVPKTIDGDIQVQDEKGKVVCPVSFGFHSAALAFSRNIADLLRDAESDVKYWHICKVMGRSASHLALEVALQTHPTLTLIGEALVDYVDEERVKKAAKRNETDYTAYGMTLRGLSRHICEAIVRRAAAGKNYGVLVIPEGLLESVNDVQLLITKISTLIRDYDRIHDTSFHKKFLTVQEKTEFLRQTARDSEASGNIPLWGKRDQELFEDIPEFFREGLLVERDSHGNFQFSRMETDKVVLGLVGDHLKTLGENGVYTLGVERSWYARTLIKAGLEPRNYEEALFENPFDTEKPLIVKKGIISEKTLDTVLKKAKLLKENEKTPEALIRVFKKSRPVFNAQPHFYGYDGRGTDPGLFDCDYTYNLGKTIFSLIAGGATGQMAVIRGLEKPVAEWEPMGIPLAALMYNEERGGRMKLVMEKKLVDVESNAFLYFREKEEEWLAADPGRDPHRHPDSLWHPGEKPRPLTLVLNAFPKSGQTGEPHK